MITLRDIGAVGIKLLGVSYLARTVLSGFSLIAVWFAPADFGPESDFVVAQIVGAIGFPAAALLLLGAGDTLASKFFPATAIPVGLGTRDLLLVGVVIVGLALAASSLPALLQAVGTGIYYAEATRQQYAEARFERQWPDLIREGLTLVTGLAVAAWAQAIANRFAVRIE